MNLSKVKTESFAHKSIPGENNVDILRLDLIDSEVSGNKYFKLKYPIEVFKDSRFSKIATFGGAYSNHILATAKFCELHEIPCVGIIRGDGFDNSNNTLSRAKELGMELVFVDREEYRLRDDKDYQKAVRDKYDAYVIPEGGKSYHGIIGCMEISNLITDNYDHVFCASGTGSTAAGLMLSMKDSIIHAVSVLKGDFMRDDIHSCINQVISNSVESTSLLDKHHVYHNFHFGGYAKFDSTLVDFTTEIYQESGLKLDPIYTAKAFYAMLEHMKSNDRKENYLFIHSGGIQGIEGFQNRYKTKLF